MNLIENYIEEVFKVEEVEHKDWMKEPYLSVTMIVNCYGSKRETNKWFTVGEWEEAKKTGYYMA